MKITNEDYIREIKRFFLGINGIRCDEGMNTIGVNWHNHHLYNDSMSRIYFIKEDMKESVERIYGTTFHSLYGKIKIKFPSSYEELCIINDLKGN